MFKRKSSPSQDEPAAPKPAGKDTPKKGRPTPTRKEAEAAQKQPLVAKSRKEAKAKAKKLRAEAYERERIALQTGDERYLPERDKGKVRRFARNWIDARRSVSELVFPVLLLFFAGTLLIGLVNPSLGATATNNIIIGLSVGIYGFFFLSFVEGFWVWFTIKKKLMALYPDEKITNGNWFYCWARMIMIRKWRSPRPQVNRGEFPEK